MRNNKLADTGPDTTGQSFKELRRKARMVRSRHPKARGAAGGSRVSQPVKAHMVPVASQNLSEKEITLEAPAAAEPTTPSPLIDHTPESQWRAAGEFDVTVYCRPLNDRLLLVRLDSGDNGRVVLNPKMRLRFGSGVRIWVRVTAKPGVYELAGRYNQWGKRVYE